MPSVKVLGVVNVVINSVKVQTIYKFGQGSINSQEPIQYEKKLIHNTKEYLIAEMDERKWKEMAEYVLHQELIHFH